MATEVSKKQLEEYPEVFADIVNVLIFNGEKVVKPEELTIDRTFPFSRKKGEHQVTQTWTQGKSRVKFSYLAFETPMVLNGYIPLRTIGYDGAVYKSDFEKATKTSDVCPIISIVAYFGFEKRWSMPTSLKSCFKMPKVLSSFMSDYKTNLFEIAWLDDNKIKQFESDFRFIVDYYTQARKNVLWQPIEGEAEHIDEVFEMLTDMTDDERFLIVLERPRLGGDSKMPSIVLDRIENGAMMAGRDDGVKTGKEYGKEELATFLLKRGKVSIEDIEEATGWSKSRVKNLLLEDEFDPFARVTTERILK